MNMTPQEINEYRSRWMARGGYTETRVDSLSYESCVAWCYENLNPGTWKGYKHATPDDFSAFIFENEKDMEKFERNLT